MLRGLGYFLSPQTWDGVPGPENGHWSLSPVGIVSVCFWSLVMDLSYSFSVSGEDFFLGDVEPRGCGGVLWWGSAL